MTGDKELAEKIRMEVREFLSTELSLELSEDKTKITHIVKGKASYLGFLISGRHRKYTESQIRKVSSRQNQRRAGNSQIIIEAPVKTLLEKLEKKGFKKKGEDKSKAKTA